MKLSASSKIPRSVYYLLVTVFIVNIIVTYLMIEYIL